MIIYNFIKKITTLNFLANTKTKNCHLCLYLDSRKKLCDVFLTMSILKKIVIITDLNLLDLSLN